MIQLNRWTDSPLTLNDGAETTARQWATQLGIAYAPSMAIFDPKGSLILKVNAMFRTFHIRGALHYAASKAYLSEPSFQRFLNQYAEDIRHQGEDVDIWKY